MKQKPFADKRGTLTVVVETPRGHRNKFKYDPTQRASTFPYDFGFIPGTKAQDGDPLDVLLLMDESAFPGCVVTARLIGVIEAEQTEDGETVRNDRLLAVATEAHDYRDVRTPKDINANLLKELEHFFVSYNECKGKKFTLLGVRGAKRALKLLKESIRHAK
jgi:inorganic pyrophosphatase